MKKTRCYYIKDHMTAAADKVENLGNFLELEIIVAKEEERAGGLDMIYELMRMLGCEKTETVIPGAEVTVVKLAPMGDPMELSVTVHGYELTSCGWQMRIRFSEIAIRVREKRTQSGLQCLSVKK